MEFGEITITGGKELADLLSKMPVRAANNVMRGALYAGAVVIRDEARRLAPVGHPPLPKGESPATLRKGIIASRGRGTRDTLVAKVHLSKDAWYGRLVEFGHRIAAGGNLRWGRSRRWGRQRGHVVGAVAPHPFMRPAFDSKRDAAIAAIAEYAHRRIEADALKQQSAAAEVFGP
jgi:HK97 gp10 family phage protein